MGDRVNYVLSVYRNYATFNGRARRTEYWAFTGFFILVMMIVSALSELGQGVGLDILGSAVLAIFVLGSFVPAFAVRVRRLHDTNRTGYWMLLSLLPVVGGLVLLVFDVLPGTKGSNRYGQDPKALGDEISEVFA